MPKYIFGPVPSRRLGMSLGVDLVTRKVCSLDCVYCEVGETTRHTIERKEYVPQNSVIRELEEYFASNSDPDYITFSGSGEPTLNSRIGDVLKFIKQIRPNVPVAVLTNGTLLGDELVRNEIMDADLVVPSLDAATESVFQSINRPHPELSFRNYIDGLIKFSREFQGRMWLEVFILPGYNDSEAEVIAIKEVIEEVKPNLIQLNSLDRPGAISGLRSASKIELERIAEILDIENVEIIAAAPARKNIASYKQDAETTILETISRRPCTVNDLVKIMGKHISEINKYLDVLQADGKIETVKEVRGTFYQIKDNA